MSRIFVNINEMSLCQLIGGAGKKLLYVAPGLTGPVADRPASLKALSANLMVLQGDTEHAIATWASVRSSDPDMQVQVHHVHQVSGKPDDGGRIAALERATI